MSICLSGLARNSRREFWIALSSDLALYFGLCACSCRQDLASGSREGTIQNESDIAAVLTMLDAPPPMPDAGEWRRSLSIFCFFVGRECEGLVLESSRVSTPPPSDAEQQPAGDRAGPLNSSPALPDGPPGLSLRLGRCVATFNWCAYLISVDLDPGQTPRGG